MGAAVRSAPVGRLRDRPGWNSRDVAGPRARDDRFLNSAKALAIGRPRPKPGSHGKAGEGSYRGLGRHFAPPMRYCDADDSWSGSAGTTFSGRDGEAGRRLSAVHPGASGLCFRSCVCDDICDILPACRADLWDDGGVCVCRCACLFGFIGLPYSLTVGSELIRSAVRRRDVLENNVKACLDFGRCKPLLSATQEGQGPEHQHRTQQPHRAY